MKKTKLIMVFASLCVLANAQNNKRVAVFSSGTEGHKSYRIPAMLSLPDGGLLAFCEGRVDGAGDYGDVNIVLKKSKDNGKTWSKLQTVVDYDKLQAGNPAPVLDLTDPLYPKGRLFLFYNTGNNHEGEVRKGKGYREVWYKTSVDGGETWSDAVNITVMVHRPKQPQINPEYNFEEDWRSYANTPGHAIQLSSGKWKGRIYVAANHSAGDPQDRFKDYKAHGFYTDDHGKTFKLSETVENEGGNENMATELNNDRLMLNFRNQEGSIRQRIVAISSDGGVKWDTTYFDKNLPDPVCQGTILTIGQQKGKSILAFCNAADTLNRDNLTLRISYDEGRTWKYNYLVDKNETKEKGDYTAYSDIVKLSDNTIGVLYERKNYSEIVFVPVKLKERIKNEKSDF